MKRVMILGRGGAGKSTLARQLGDITGLPVIELDKLFWRRGCLATPRDEWTEMQRTLIEEERWILDGDLGQYDAIEVRLGAADTVVLLDLSFVRCAWRAFRKSREHADFWRWLLLYRLQSRPLLMKAIAKYSPRADLRVLGTHQEVRRFLEDCSK